ncbi:MAG TPA: S1 RNA-binding domain-containing protein, partial [Polyangiaceae bacterium]|nr:S1 RNA-binding domain-containing protein [Polyangiaceae bacterium]
MTHETTHETGNEPQHDPGLESGRDASHESSGEFSKAIDATASSAVETPAATEPAENSEETGESFADALRDFERARTRRPAGQQAAAEQLEGTVVSLTADQVILDVGYKMEGVLPRSSFENNAESVKRGDKFPVSIKGRSEEGYYELSRFRVAQPRDWSALEQAFAEKTPIVGTVTAAVKGGLSVDVGVRAFMPASRSGTRDAAELEALVGTEITCRITKL